MNFLLALSFFFSFLIASIELEGYSARADFEIVVSNSLEFVGEFRSGEMEVDEVNVVDDVFSIIRSQGYHSSQLIGSPELPELHRLIEIPQGAIPRIEILDEEYKVYDLRVLGFSEPLFPHQPSLSKSQDPANVNFEFNTSIYDQDSYVVEEMVVIEDKGMLRSMRLGNLIIRPVDYNPAKGLLKIWKKISIKVHFDGADLILTENLKLKHHSPYFDVLYDRVINHDSFALRDDLVSYPVTYVIITNPIFESTLSDFVDWKIQKGFNVVVGNTAEIGSSTSSIKAFLQDLYENPADGFSSPSFVLFVGDIAQVPSYSGSTGSHPTDLYYCEYTGDLIPEVYHGRFSAQNLNHLQAQISKTLEYEKYEMPDPSYLSEVLMVSGVDGSFAAIHGNGQINYGNDYYFNNDHGIYSHTYLYPESDGSGAAAAIIQDYNEGVGFANYTAHCSPSGWADPSFSVSDVPGLYNDHEYNLMIGNCCNSAQFDVESFGEAVLRSENNGAVGYIGGTNSTYWDEDYWWGVGSGSVSANPTYESTGIGVYDGIFHENGEDEEQWFVVNDAINMAGNLAVVEAGSSLDDYYWEIYHNMGDPSLITYMGIPIENNVSHLPILQIGTNTFNISADPYSFVALSMDGVLYGTAYMGSSSNVEMEIIPFNVAGTASVVVTGQNKQPYFGSVEVGNADGPYVVVDEFMLLSSDGDEVIEYGETVNISMTLKNVGNEITSGITVTLSINDEYITLIDDQSAFGDLMPEETITLENVFSFNVASQVPDDYSFSMVANVWGSGQFWDYNLNMAAFAPVLSFEGVEVVSELDGQLDPGDTADIGVIIHNSGGSDLSGMNVIISSEDEYVTINGDSNYFLDNLNVDESAAAYYNLSADSNTPIGHIMSFNIMVTASGSYEEDLFGSLTVGLTWEDFESGSFVGLPWNFSGNADWQISSDGYEGMHGAESGSISDNETSELNVSANVTAGDDISFYYKVSSEGSYDYLRFYIDGVEQGAWSGDIGWTQASFSVSPGEHLFRWVYSKDGSVSSGSDMAWIDYIVFPPIGAPMFPEINISIDELSLDLEVDSQEVEQFVISNSGEGDLQYNIQVVLDSPESSIQHESIKLDKGANDAREGMLFDRGSGGPDAFGYTWIDSDELGGPAATWIEIDFCGIPIGNGDDSNEGPFELGFPFYFYGNEYNSVRVSTNGFLSFTSTATSYTNQSIPSNGDPNALLAPFWDDLNPSSGGQMYYFSWGDHFVVQWDEVPLYSGGGSETFQVVLYADGRILFNYKTVTAVDGCTVGIENESGTDGLQVVFNSNYLHDDMTILFSSDFLQPWLNVFPITGVLPSGGESIISVSFDSNQLLDGIYTGNLNVYSNDPSQTLVALPVAMVVGSECSNPGDANGDGEVSILDIIRLINCILDDECGPCYDLNDDGSVNIQDIISIINIILD